jgi:hypothetical protein
LDEETKKFHKTNRGLDFSLFVYPYNCIGTGHHDFPYDFLDDFVGLKNTILGYFGGVRVNFKLDKVTGAHP